MRSIRIHSSWPDSHPDYEIVDWDSEDYDLIIRHFGCFPYGALNGNSDASPLRGGRILRTVEDIHITGNKLRKPPGEDCWWKIKGDKSVFDNIDYEFMMFLATVRITKDKLAMMYEIYKNS